jgi:transcription initiation factor TFIID subunit 2
MDLQYRVGFKNPHVGFAASTGQRRGCSDAGKWFPVTPLDSALTVIQAIEWLQARQPRSLISTVLIRTVMDERYFYGVRMAAVNALTRCATPELDYIGQFHLLKAFQSLFCFENSSMTRSNDFSDQRLYHIQCEIPKALSRIRDSRGKAPSEVKRFFLDRLKFNDNSSNEYSDNYYVATLLNCLAESMIEPQISMSFEFEDLSEEAAEIDFKRAALNEIERHRRIDEWIPSYRNLYTRAALHCQKRLIEAKAAPRRVAVFMQYLRPGNLDEVRLAALDALIQLGMLRESTFLRCALYLFSTEPSPFLRDQFWALIERGFGLIAFDDDPLPSQAPSDGFTIAEGESAEARQERAERTESIEGALKSLRRRLGDNKVLQESLMDALRSPVLGIKDFIEVLGACNMLYTPGRGVVVTLKYPRYYNLQYMGDGNLRFFRINKWRTEKMQQVDYKSLKRRASTHRSLSPEAKRRRMSITLSQKNVPLVAQPSLSLPAQTPQSSLPSPTASQPTSFSNTLDNHILSPTAAIPQQPGSRASTPKASRSSTSRASTPIAVRAPIPKVARAPTPKAATLKVSPPKTAAPKASAPKASAPKPTKPKAKLLVKLKFLDKKADFAAKVGDWAEAPESPDDDQPLAISVARLGTQPNVASVAPPPSRPSPAPVPSSSTLDAPPKAPFKVKLKLKMGGGSGAA